MIYSGSSRVKCFEKTKQTHTSDCERQLANKAKLTSYSAVNVANKKASFCKYSHYKSTFKFDPKARPATTYQPPTDGFFDGPKGSFDFNTTQKSEYKKYDFQPRQQPFKLSDNHEFSKEAVSGVSSYLADFKPTASLDFPAHVKRDPNKVTLTLPSHAFTSKTTANEHFKDWNQRCHTQPTRGFGELPSHAGHAIFPTKERTFVTHTKSVHDPKKLPQRTEIQRMEARGNLTLEGSMEFNTANRDSFVGYPCFEVAQPFLPQRNEALVGKGSFKTETTQNQRDFVFHADHRPPKPADCNPYLSKIENDLYPGPERMHVTTQKTEFKGIDVTSVGRTKSFKVGPEKYVIPTEKVLGETVSMRDFKPIDISSLPVLKAIKREGTLRVAAGAMETQTMSQLQFLRYDVKPMVMARDSHPDYYCPPQTKFDGSTTTGETFKGKQTPRRLAFQPDASNIDIKSGSFDFNTTQKLEFKNHGLSMCEAKAYMIAKALHDEKLKKQVKALSSSCSEVTMQA